MKIGEAVEENCGRFAISTSPRRGEDAIESLRAIPNKLLRSTIKQNTSCRTGSEQRAPIDVLRGVFRETMMSVLARLAAAEASPGAAGHPTAVAGDEDAGQRPR
ncbi:MAG: hypothetical protein D6723_14605 [Acidobacteria bacterium]|nr:MAG: hypothetical protein D6723_14605 [Acidobacteriota bacterium]